MQRIEKTFLQGQAFVGYLTAGDGGLARTLSAMHALVEGGVDILEVGVPFSDPIADGPIIQQAAERALASRAESTRAKRFFIRSTAFSCSSELLKLWSLIIDAARSRSSGASEAAVSADSRNRSTV